MKVKKNKMKKLLLLLLCVPLIGLGQTNYKNWENVYSHQKHDNLNSPEDILKEFGIGGLFLF